MYGFLTNYLNKTKYMTKVEVETHLILFTDILLIILLIIKYSNIHVIHLLIYIYSVMFPLPHQLCITWRVLLLGISVATVSDYV